MLNPEVVKQLQRLPWSSIATPGTEDSVCQNYQGEPGMLIAHQGSGHLLQVRCYHRDPVTDLASAP